MKFYNGMILIVSLCALAGELKAGPFDDIFRYFNPDSTEGIAEFVGGNMSIDETTVSDSVFMTGSSEFSAFSEDTAWLNTVRSFASDAKSDAESVKSYLESVMSSFASRPEDVILFGKGEYSMKSGRFLTTEQPCFW